MRVNLTSTKPTLEERESKGKEEERANANAVARTTMSSSSSTETQTEWQTYWCHQCDLGVHLLVSISLSCPHCNLHTFLELMDSAAAASTSCAETNLLLHHFSNPCIKISPSMLAIDPSLICAVCREEFHVDAEANQLPCNHLFHPDCILPWLSSNNSCPLCRFRLTSI